MNYQLINEIRKQKLISINQLELKGIDRLTFYNCINNKRITVEFLEKISQALNVDIEIFFTKDESINPFSTDESKQRFNDLEKRISLVENNLIAIKQAFNNNH